MRRSTGLFFLVLPFCAGAAVPGGYRLTDRISLRGEPSWNYVAIDDLNRRLYVAHQTEVEVLNVDTGAALGRIPNLRDVHGIAIAPHISRGYVTHADAAKVTIFDLKTLERRGDVNTGRQPHAIVYDMATGYLFAFNEGSSNATAIKDGDLITSIDLGGRPKFAVADGHGRIFVNLEDRNAIATLDSGRLAVTQLWPLTACEQPASMAIDTHNDRLFIGCGNRTMAVIDTLTGREVATLPIGEHVDGTAFDRESGLIFNSADGALTLIRQLSPDSYSVVETVRTHDSSRSMALDSKTHRVFVPFAESGAAGVFGLLVMSRP